MNACNRVSKARHHSKYVSLLTANSGRAFLAVIAAEQSLTFAVKHVTSDAQYFTQFPVWCMVTGAHGPIYTHALFMNRCTLLQIKVT